MEVLGPGSLKTALVGAEKRFPDAGHRFAVPLEQGAHLFDDVGKSDAMGETMRFDSCCPELRSTLFMNLFGDSGSTAPDRQAARPSSPR
ncbi:hypothetical protein GCM10022226_52620 [Sphaerisporangium flaviroseum]|uniref:Uncharacterized protein n=1 Tax=Sphaerisporangium flaviroseum TaxID=509199 RepID=A0ABP7IRU0_9ACTN